MQRASVVFIIAVLATTVGAGAIVAQDDDTFALGEGRFEIEG